MKAILWDLDDTLLNTLPARMKALEHAYEKCLGQRTDPMALWRSTRGGTLEDLGKRLLGADFLKFTACYREHYYGSFREIRAFEGVEDVLHDAHAAGWPMAVVTSKVSWGAIEELGQVDLLKYFAAVIGFDDTEQHKPDPEPIFEALERLLVDEPADAMFIGDSPADIFAARNAGCASVAALWGTLDAEVLRDACPDFIADHPHHVLTALTEKVGVAR